MNLELAHIFKFYDSLPDELRQGFVCLAKSAWCSIEQQRLFQKYHKKNPEMTSVVIISWSLFPDYEIVVTFNDGTRLSRVYDPDGFIETADQIVGELLQEYAFMQIEKKGQYETERK